MTKDELEKSRAEIMDRKEQNTMLIHKLESQIAEVDRLNNLLESATAPLRRDTYTAATDTYGKHSQLIIAMEEMAELTKELSKNIRGEKNITAISEEIADVEIMLEQLKVIFSNRAEVDLKRSEKLKRLAKHLTDAMA